MVDICTCSQPLGICCTKSECCRLLQGIGSSRVSLGVRPRPVVRNIPLNSGSAMIHHPMMVCTQPASHAQKRHHSFQWILTLRTSPISAVILTYERQLEVTEALTIAVGLKSPYVARGLQKYQVRLEYVAELSENSESGRKRKFKESRQALRITIKTVGWSQWTPSNLYVCQLARSM